MTLLIAAQARNSNVISPVMNGEAARKLSEPWVALSHAGEKMGCFYFPGENTKEYFIREDNL